MKTNLTVVFLSSLQVEDLDDKTWKLLSPLKFRVIGIFQGKEIDREFEIPTGYVTDFGSVPRIAFIYEFFGNIAHRATAGHDYLYDIGVTPEDKDFADEVLFAGMIATGYSAYEYYPIYEAVHLFGGSHFNRTHRKESESISKIGVN